MLSERKNQLVLVFAIVVIIVGVISFLSYVPAGDSNAKGIFSKVEKVPVINQIEVMTNDAIRVIITYKRLGINENYEYIEKLYRDKLYKAAFDYTSIKLWNSKDEFMERYTFNDFEIVKMKFDEHFIKVLEKRNFAKTEAERLELESIKIKIKSQNYALKIKAEPGL